jgi:hypothetical protein
LTNRARIAGKEHGIQSIIDRTHADRPALWTRQMQTDGVLQNQSENFGLDEGSADKAHTGRQIIPDEAYAERQRIADGVLQMYVD